MNLFYSENKELRAGWKILRVLVLAILLTLLLAVLASLLKVKALAEYAVHTAIIVSTLLELWLEKRSLSFVGWNLRDKGLWKDFLVGILWGALSIGLVAAGMIVFTRELEISQIGQGIESVNWLSLLLFWLVVAVAEEILFRGYILSILKERVDLKLSLVIAAGLFSAIHLVNPDYYWFAFVYAFLIGVMLGGVVIWRGSLGCVIGFHYVWNLLQDKGLLNLPARGGEVVYAVVLLINIGLVYWLLPHRSTSAG